MCLGPEPFWADPIGMVPHRNPREPAEEQDGTKKPNPSWPLWVSLQSLAQWHKSLDTTSGVLNVTRPARLKSLRRQHDECYGDIVNCALSPAYNPLE